MNVRQAFPEAKLIFIEPPSIEELNNRLAKRASESLDVVKKRLEIAKSEIAKKDEFDISIVNDNLNKATQQVVNYIKSI